MKTLGTGILDTMKGKLFRIAFAIFAIYPFFSYGVTVIPSSSSSGSIGKSFGEGLVKGYTKAKKAKEAEKQKVIEARNSVYIYEMLRDYDPLNHEEFVSCIQRSELPEYQKILIICEFNDRYLTWRKEKERA